MGVRSYRQLLLIGTLVAVQLGSGDITNENTVGTFWQLTDVHYDRNYSSYPHGSGHLCRQHRGYQNLSGEAGNGWYGDYNCDSPWSLVTLATEAMKTLVDAGQPDFILWTGDNAPHAPDALIDLDYVTSAVGNVTSRLRTAFPDTPIYPTLGNHDTWPNNQYPDGPNDIYPGVLDNGQWEALLGDEEKQTFLQGGYYSTITTYGLKVVSINSNLWYAPNHQVANVSDPSYQFVWLESVLKQARLDKQKVLLEGHEPPGVSTRFLYQGYYPRHNARFLALLRDYHDVVVTCVFGHTHTDSYKLVYDTQGNPVSVVYVAPAVTPISQHNPSVRLYTYHRHSGAVLDYTQYYLDLSRANPLAGEGAPASSPAWQVEYRLRGGYGVAGGGPRDMHLLLERLITDEALFDAYYLRNAVSRGNETCAGACRHGFLCAMKRIDYAEYASCVGERRHLAVIVACSAAAVALILLLTVAVVRVRSRRTLKRYSETDYALVEHEEDEDDEIA